MLFTQKIPNGTSQIQYKFKFNQLKLAINSSISAELIALIDIEFS